MTNDNKTPAAVDEKYVNLVAQYVRGQLPDNIAATLLNDDSEAERMYYALVSLKKDVEAQLADRAARDVITRKRLENQGDDGSQYLEYRAGEADWRSRAIRFLTSIEEHILATKERMKRYNRQQNGSGEQLAEIKRDISYHREQIDEDEATEADRRVWRHA